MTIDNFLHRLNDAPETIDFTETMALIDSLYRFTPASFRNGELINEAGQNNGSCKLFAFGQLHRLSEPQTLACFGRYYREDVLQNPAGEDHQNIRHFMRHGWSGIKFKTTPLTPINQ